MVEKVVIGDATLYCGDCLEVLPELAGVDAVVTDPPYSGRTHEGHDDGARPGEDGARRQQLGYDCWTPDQARQFARIVHEAARGWIVWMCDHHFVPVIQSELEEVGRYVFAPIPYFAPGSRVRLSGDGPSSWTIWIMVARTSAQHRWGTLPGGYLAQPGWRARAKMGGKPVPLMESLVRDYSRQGDLICDPCMGRGTTGVAAFALGRPFVGIERDRDEFHIACERIEQAQKQGKLFEETA